MVKTLTEASASFLDDHLRFLSQFTASFAHEMRKWSLTDEGMAAFLAGVFERLQMPPK